MSNSEQRRKGMSLYNLIHGENENADLLLALLGLNRSNVPRYRDCYWNGEEIAIYTRTGGGNRDYYESLQSCRENYPKYFKGDDNPSGPWNEELRKLPTFLRDKDDDFDSTYATFYFKVPDQLKSAVEQLRAADATPEQRWDAVLTRLQSPTNKDDPQIKRVTEAMKPLFDQIASKLEK